MKTKKRLGKRKPYVFFLIPALAVYSVFWVIPICFNFFLGFTSWKGLAKKMEFVGISNFVKIIGRDLAFWSALKNNLIFGGVSLVFGVGIGLVLALLLDRLRMRVSNVFKVIIFIPFVTAWVVVALLWKWMYDPIFGLINLLLSSMGLRFLAQNWLGDPAIAIYSISAVSIWKSWGFSMIIFLAGLSAIPTQLKEAAYIDGATELQVIWKIVLPLLRPVISVVVVLTIMSSFGVFDCFYVMVGAGGFVTGLGKVNVLTTYIYNLAFARSLIGYGAALSVMLFLISVFIAIAYIATLGKESFEL